VLHRGLSLAAVFGLAAALASCGDGGVVAPGPPCTPPVVPITAADPGFQLVGMTEPVCPEAAREQGHQGSVFVRTIADHDGSVCETTVASSSGYAELDSAAVTAARTARFSEAWSGGRPVRVEVIVPVEFRLHPSIERPNTTLQPAAPRLSTRALGRTDGK